MKNMYSHHYTIEPRDRSISCFLFKQRGAAVQLAISPEVDKVRLYFSTQVRELHYRNSIYLNYGIKNGSKNINRSVLV